MMSCNENASGPKRADPNRTKYQYDGARNIKQIGGDLYRYDSSGRLTWSRVVGGTGNGTIDIDNDYDIFGNMTDSKTTPLGEGPAGLHFAGRTHAGNKLVGAPYGYDSNGNLSSEAAHDGVGGYRYSFSPENQIAYITGTAAADLGKWFLEASYDAEGNRWMRRTWADGGKSVITLRDATGKVTTEFEGNPTGAGLKHIKDYLYAGSQLVAVNSYCGPRPDLVLDTPSKANGNVRFVRTDHVPSESGFTILIQTAGGQRKVLTRPSTLATHFEIAESELFPYDNNLVSIQTDAECGATGHSNAVSYAYFPPQEPLPSCISTLGGSRSGGSGGTAGYISLQSTQSCPSGTGYVVYFMRLGDDAWGPLNTVPVTNPNKLLSNQPAGTGYGRYEVVPVDGEGFWLASGPFIDLGPPNDDPDPGPGGGGSTLPPGVNAQFFHWDHLGSTRAITDEKGVLIAHYKYYPFGLLADVAGGEDNRMMFTGHERDSSIGLDYMLARYCGTTLGRFLSVDPAIESAKPGAPQTWNRYSYVLNTPLNANDPSGMAEVILNDATQKVQFEKELEATAGPGITLVENTIQFDDTQLGSGAKYSPEARGQLKELTSTSTPGTALLVLNPNMPPQNEPGVTRVASPAPPGRQGPDMAVIEVSGRAGNVGFDTAGKPLATPSPVALIHEVAAAKNILQAVSPGPSRNAVAVENVVRRQLGLPKRMPEPDHPD